MGCNAAAFTRDGPYFTGRAKAALSLRIPYPPGTIAVAAILGTDISIGCTPLINPKLSDRTLAGLLVTVPSSPLAKCFADFLGGKFLHLDAKLLIEDFTGSTLAVEFVSIPQAFVDTTFTGFFLQRDKIQGGKTRSSGIFLGVVDWLDTSPSRW